MEKETICKSTTPKMSLEDFMLSLVPQESYKKKYVAAQ